MLFTFGLKRVSALESSLVAMLEPILNPVWVMIGFGEMPGFYAIIGAAIIIADQYLKSKGSSFRMPVLAVAVGLYLPFELDSSIFLGGLLAWALTKATKSAVNKERADNAGLLLASGLITGEALTGIGIAIAIVMGVEMAVPHSFIALYENIGVVILLLIVFFVYRTVNGVAKKADD